MDIEENQNKESQSSSTLNAAQKANLARNAYVNRKKAYSLLKRLGKSLGKKAATASLSPGALLGIVILFLVVGTGLFMFGLIGGGIPDTTATEEGAQQGAEIEDLGVGSPSADISPDIGIPAGRPTPLFRCQYDPQWKSSSCQINKYGCAPTTDSMIFGAFGDTHLTPPVVGRQVGGCSGATSYQSQINYFKSQGYKVGPNLASGNNFNLESAKKFIDNGYLILAGAPVNCNRCGDNPTGHAFLIYDVDVSTQNVKVLDPTFCKTDSEYDPIVRNVNTDTFPYIGKSRKPASRWFYAVPIKK